MQPMPGRDSTPIARSNRGISIFAEEKQKMASRKSAKTPKTETPEVETPEVETTPAAAAPVVTVTATPAQSIKQEREALKAAGLKRCPTHLRLLDRLPEESRFAVTGYEDVSIRRMSEYQKNTSTCRACDHLIRKDWRASHKQPSTGTQNAEQKLAKLIAQRDALTLRIEALQATLALQTSEA